MARPPAAGGILACLILLLWSSFAGAGGQVSSPASDASSGRWREGVHFQRLQPDASAPDRPGQDVEVVEFLWFGCPHCYHLEPRVSQWARRLPAYVHFARVPIIWDRVTLAHARLFFTLQVLKASKLEAAVFDEIHLKGHSLVDSRATETERQQLAFARSLGIDDANFERVYHSAEVETRLSRAKQIAMTLQVTRVPTFVIDRRFKTDRTRMDENDSELFALIDALILREHRHEELDQFR